MKKYLIIMLMSFPFTLLAQQGVSIYGNYNPSVLVLYTNNYKDYIDAGNKIKLTNYDIGVNSQVYRDQNIAIRLGVRYKDMRLHLKYYEDTIIDYDYIIPWGHGDYDIGHDSYHYIDTIANIISSKSIGVNLDFSYHFGRKYQHDIGFISDYYFFEDYKSIFSSKKLNYVRSANVLKSEEGQYEMLASSKENFRRIAKRNQILYRKFFTSAVDLQLYYQYTLNFSKNFSLGFRASIGTNLYSDWNQFKKYVWVGFGVNFGFLSNEKVRLNKKMPLGEVDKKESM